MDFIRTKEFQSISLSNYWILRNTIFQTFDQQRCQKVLLKTSFTIWTILIMSCNQKKKKNMILQDPTYFRKKFYIHRIITRYSIFLI